MEHVRTLECTLCGETYDPEQIVYTCSNHPGVQGILEVQYDYDVVRERFDEPLDGNIRDQWKYRAFLPVEEDAEPVTLREGGTDLYDTPRLSDELGVEMRVKDDGRNPTGVLKDRATSVSVTKATHAGRDAVTCASTGNAAASLAGYAGADSTVGSSFRAMRRKGNSHNRWSTVRTYSPSGELRRGLRSQYGGNRGVRLVQPQRCDQPVSGRGQANRRSRTRRANAGDAGLVGVLDGRRLYDLRRLEGGFANFAISGSSTKRRKCSAFRPKVRGAIHDAYHEHDSTDDVANTLADSIAVGRPRNTLKAVKALNESGGTSVVVSDDEILRGKTLGSTEGITPNPPGGPHRGIRKGAYRRIIDEDESVLAVVTGYGLKDAKKSAGGVRKRHGDRAELDEVKQRYSP